jgi:hypothetical protein
MLLAGCAGGKSEGGSAAPTTPSSPTTSTALSSQVVFHLTGKTPSSDSVRGGGGSGKFTLSGATTDSGSFVDYRSVSGDVIRIRRVLSAADGKLTMVVRIKMGEGDKGWTITSGSGRYKGAEGKGEELGGVDSAGDLDITMNGSLTGV